VVKTRLLFEIDSSQKLEKILKEDETTINIVSPLMSENSYGKTYL